MFNYKGTQFDEAQDRQYRRWSTHRLSNIDEQRWLVSFCLPSVPLILQMQACGRRCNPFHKIRLSIRTGLPRGKAPEKDRRMWFRDQEVKPLLWILNAVCLQIRGYWRNSGVRDEGRARPQGPCCIVLCSSEGPCLSAFFVSLPSYPCWKEWWNIQEVYSDLITRSIQWADQSRQPEDPTRMFPTLKRMRRQNVLDSTVSWMKSIQGAMKNRMK